MEAAQLSEFLIALRWDLIQSLLVAALAIFISKWFVEWSAEQIKTWNERRKLVNHPYFREGGPVIDRYGRRWMIKEIRRKVIVLSGDIGLWTIPITQWEEESLVFAWIAPIVRSEKGPAGKCPDCPNKEA